MLPFEEPYGHRRSRIEAHVVVEELSVTDAGQHVAVGHDEWFARASVQHCKRARRAKRGIFAQVCDGDAPARTVAEMRFDHVPEVVDREAEAREALGFRALDDVLEHRLACYR